MRSNLLSAASNLPASSAAFCRAAAVRAGLAARACVQAARRRPRRNLGIAVVAAVVVAGLIAGLVAALVPSGPAAPVAAASGTVPAHAAADHATAPGTAAAGKSVKVQAGNATAHATAHTQATNDAAASASTKPYSMYDSVTPSQIPAGHPVATYATGGYAVSAAQAGKQAILIDTNGSAPAKASVLDIEPGNVPPSAAAGWAAARLTAHPHAVVRIYTMLSQWDAAKASIHTLPGWMQTHVKWWIADPTGVQHVVPGSDATQWYWGPAYDISTVNPGF